MKPMAWLSRFLQGHSGLRGSGSILDLGGVQVRLQRYRYCALAAPTEERVAQDLRLAWEDVGQALEAALIAAEHGLPPR
jgi:hypothetical protein